MLRHALVLALLVGCGRSQVKLVDRWRDPEALDGPYQRYLVVGISDNTEARETFERLFARAVRGTGVEATASFDVVGPTLEKDEIRTAVAEHGFDAVLAARVTGRRQASTYEEGTTWTAAVTHPSYAAAEPWASPYGSGWTIYPWVMETAQTGGGWRVERHVEVQTVLFRAADAAEVWHARSDAVDPKTLEKATRQLAQSLVQDLQQVGMLPRREFDRDADVAR